MVLGFCAAIYFGFRFEFDFNKRTFTQLIDFNCTNFVVFFTHKVPKKLSSTAGIKYIDFSPW